MKMKLAGLAEAMTEKKLIRVNREPTDEFGLDGFVVGLSEKLVLLHVVDGHDLRLNGYVAVRLRDIKSYEIDTSFIPRYLHLRGVVAALINIELTDMTALIASVGRQYSLLTIECEKTEPGSCFIGRIDTLTKRSLKIRSVDTNALWDTIDGFAVGDITQVRFADGYTEALKWMIERNANQTE